MPRGKLTGFDLHQLCPEAVGRSAHLQIPGGPGDGALSELQFDDALRARIHNGFPIFGKTRTPIRVPVGIGAGVELRLGE
jgi:hypothetical protein